MWRLVAAKSFPPVSVIEQLTAMEHSQKTISPARKILGWSFLIVVALALLFGWEAMFRQAFSRGHGVSLVLSIFVGLIVAKRRSQKITRER